MEEPVKRYETDPGFRKKAADILADGGIPIRAFRVFAKKHNVNISPKDMPGIVREAENLGFIRRTDPGVSETGLPEKAATPLPVSTDLTG